MRRHRRTAMLAAVTALVLGLTLLTSPPVALAAPTSPVYAAGGSVTAGRGGATPRERARRVLARAEHLLAGQQPDARRGPATAGDLTPVLRELFLARRYLSGPDRRAAGDLLARPTDGRGDPYGDGYVTASRVLCGEHVCVHWVTRGYDRPRSARWVRTTLQVMEHTWRVETGRLGYRPPLSDGTRGGDSRFDVYLADVGAKGYYGYCAAESYAPRNRSLASGYCVLDDDFSRYQFRAAPKDSLRVTAAHEFFHAIQYGYRVDQDRWLAEATATWMEEQVADPVNDNRQFLAAGQLGRPGEPLDVFGVDRFNEYGNWAFFAYLAQRFGPRIVRSIWNHSAARPLGQALPSVDALRAALRTRGRSFAGVYAGFAAAVLTPDTAFAEGRAWRPAPVAASYRLGRATTSTGRVPLTLRHLTSRSVRVRPASTSGRARVKVMVQLPAATAAPAARVTLRTRAGVVRSLPVPIGRDRHGSLVAPFGARRIAWVTVTVVNASTRYRCGQGTPWACRGVPLDDASTSVVAVRLLGR